MKENTGQGIHLQDPQNSLEVVLKTEIEVGEKISEARDRAEEQVESARKDQAGIKEKIIAEARKERDQIYKQEIEKARKSAEEKIQNAEKKAEDFLARGLQHLDEAVDKILGIILPADQGSSK